MRIRRSQSGTTHTREHQSNQKRSTSFSISARRSSRREVRRPAFPAHPILPRDKIAWHENNALQLRLLTRLAWLGLDIPFLLLPYRPTSDPSAVRTFIRHFHDDAYGLRGDILRQDLRMTEPMVIHDSSLSAKTLGTNCCIRSLLVLPNGAGVVSLAVLSAGTRTSYSRSAREVSSN